LSSNFAYSDFDPRKNLPPLDEVLSPELQKEIRLKKATRIQGFDYSGLPLWVDLRYKATSIKKQNEPWCTAYGLAAVMEMNGADGKTDISERHIWSHYKKYSCERAIKKTFQHRMTIEDYWPIWKRKPYRGYMNFAELSIQEVEYIDMDVRRVFEALSEGRAVYLGISVSESMGKCDIRLEAESKNTGGGHAIAVVGYEIDPLASGGAWLLIKNSWGEDCADRGYQWIPVGYCERKDSYCMFWDVKKVVGRE
jgi:hypothetical protein